MIFLLPLFGASYLHTKFLVSSILLSWVMARGQKWPPSPVLEGFEKGRS